MKKIHLLTLFILAITIFSGDAKADGHYVYCHFPDGHQETTVTNNSLDTLSAMSLCQSAGGSANTVERIAGFF